MLQTLPQSSVNWKSEPTFFAFEAGLVVHVVFSLTLFGGGALSEVGRGVHESCGHLKVICDIGPVMDEATWLDDAGEQFGEGLVEDAALVVSGFPPRIGEVDVCCVDGGWGNEGREGADGVSAKDSGIGQVAFLQPFGGSTTFCVVDFESDKVCLRVAECGGEDKQSAAGADIQFDWLAGREEGVPVELWGEVVEGLEPGLEWPSGGRRGHAVAFAGVLGVGRGRWRIV